MFWKKFEADNQDTIEDVNTEDDDINAQLQQPPQVLLKSSPCAAISFMALYSLFCFPCSL